MWHIHGVRSARLCVLKSLIPPEAMHPNPWTWHIHPCLTRAEEIICSLQTSLSSHALHY